MSDYEVLGQVLGFQGMNYDMIEELLPPEDEPYFLADGENILIKNGKVQKLRGTDYLNSISTQVGIAGYRPVIGFAIYRKYAGTKYLMAVTPQRLYYLKTDSEWYNLGTIIDGGNDSLFTYARLLDKFIFCVSDSKFIWYWDGTTFGKLFTAPDDDNRQARMVLGFKTFLFLLRTIETVDLTTTEYYNRIWYSNPGVITTFDEVDKLDLDAEGKILNGQRLENEIIVYMDSSVHRVYWAGDTEGFLSEPVSDQGIYAWKTLCGNKDVHYYLSLEGFMKHLRGDVPRSISDKKFNKLILDQIDPVYYYRATAEFYAHLNLVFLSYPKSGSTFNDIQLLYDTTANELVSKKTLLVDNYSAYGSFEKDLSALSPDERKAWGLSIIPIFGTNDGFIKEQKIHNYQDGTSNYETSLTFPGTFWKSRDKRKRLMQIDLLIEKLTDSDITFIIDIANELNANYAFTHTITGNGNTGLRRYELRSDDNGVGLDVLGKEFKVRIRDSNNPYGFNFHGAIFKGYWGGAK